MLEALINIIAWIVALIIFLSPAIIIGAIIYLCKKRKNRKTKRKDNKFQSEWVWDENRRLWVHESELARQIHVNQDMPNYEEWKRSRTFYPRTEKKPDSTYRYDYVHIPNEDPPQEQPTHFHHTDTTFKVKQQPVSQITVDIPKEVLEKVKEAKEDNSANNTKIEPEKLTQKQIDTINLYRISFPREIKEEVPKTPVGPRIIYTYPKPELKPEDREEEKDGFDFRTAYQRREFLTKNEWYNYKKLQEIANAKGYIICPKVRLFDLVEPRKEARKKKTYQYKIQSKHVDFVICDQNMNIKAILELDDNSHYNPQTIHRDELVNTILLSVGYTVIRTKYIDFDIFDNI